jgi:hypothetical protein
MPDWGAIVKITHRHADWMPSRVLDDLMEALSEYAAIASSNEFDLNMGMALVLAAFAAPRLSAGLPGADGPCCLGFLRHSSPAGALRLVCISVPARTSIQSEVLSRQ